MRKIIDSVFRNIVVWFSLILVSFLAVVSFLFTSVFEWDESNQYLPEVIHYKSDIFNNIEYFNISLWKRYRK